MFCDVGDGSSCWASCTRRWTSGCGKAACGLRRACQYAVGLLARLYVGPAVRSGVGAEGMPPWGTCMMGGAAHGFASTHSACAALGRPMWMPRRECEECIPLSPCPGPPYPAPPLPQAGGQRGAHMGGPRGAPGAHRGPPPAHLGHRVTPQGACVGTDVLSMFHPACGNPKGLSEAPLSQVLIPVVLAFSAARVPSGTNGVKDSPDSPELLTGSLVPKNLVGTHRSC